MANLTESDSVRTLDTTTSSMDVVSLNNLIVSMRDVMRKAKVQLIHKLARQAKTLRGKKGNEEQTAKNNEKANRLAEEIKTIKVMNLHKAAKFSLANTETYNDVASKSKWNSKDRALVRVATHPSVEEKVRNWRSEHEDWKSLAAFILHKTTGRRYRNKKIVHDGINIGVDKMLRKKDTKKESDSSDSDDDESTEKTKRSMVNTVEKSESLTEKPCENVTNESITVEERKLNKSDEKFTISKKKVDQVSKIVEDDNKTENKHYITEKLRHSGKSNLSKSKTVAMSHNNVPDSASDSFEKRDELESCTLHLSPTNDLSDVTCDGMKGIASEAETNKKDDTCDVEIKHSNSLESVKKPSRNLFLPLRKKEMVIKKIRIDNIDKELEMLKERTEETVDSDSNSNCSKSEFFHKGTSLFADNISNDEVSHRKKDSFFMNDDGESIDSADSDNESNSNNNINNDGDDDDADELHGQGKRMVESVFVGKLCGNPEIEKHRRQKWLDSTWRERPNKQNAFQNRSNASKQGRGARGGKVQPRRSDSNGNNRNKEKGQEKIPTSNKLHPSWEASKKRKELQSKIPTFLGKKTKFDDSD